MPFIYTTILKGASANSTDLDQGLLEFRPPAVWHTLGQHIDRIKLDFLTLYVCRKVEIADPGESI